MIDDTWWMFDGKNDQQNAQWFKDGEWCSILHLHIMNLNKNRMEQKNVSNKKNKNPFEVANKILVGGFNPFEKILMKMGIFPK